MKNELIPILEFLPNFHFLWFTTFSTSWYLSVQIIVVKYVEIHCEISPETSYQYRASPLTFTRLTDQKRGGAVHLIGVRSIECLVGTNITNKGMSESFNGLVEFFYSRYLIHQIYLV